MNPDYLVSPEFQNTLSEVFNYAVPVITLLAGYVTVKDLFIPAVKKIQDNLLERKLRNRAMDSDFA